MTPEQFIASVPDPALRNAIGEFICGLIDKQLNAALDRSECVITACKHCAQPFFRVVGKAEICRNCHIDLWRKDYARRAEKAQAGKRETQSQRAGEV